MAAGVRLPRYCGRARACRPFASVPSSGHLTTERRGCGKGSCRIWNGRGWRRVSKSQWRSGRTKTETQRDDRRAARPRGAAIAELRRARRPAVLLVAGDCGRLDRAAADRDAFPEERVRAARRDRELSSRPRRLAHPAGQQPRHRRSQASRPRRALRAHPDAAEVERQLRGLPHRRSRRAAARAGWSTARSAGARSTSCCRRRATSRSRCPNFVLDIADSTIALATPFGPVGVALEGNGKLSGGFKGQVAVASPRLVPGRCAATDLHANVAVAVVARRPQIDGPVTLDALHLSGEPFRRRRAALRRQGELQREPSPASTAAAGWRSAPWSPAPTASPISSATSPTRARSSDVRRPGEAVGAEVAARHHLCRPDAAQRRLQPRHAQRHIRAWSAISPPTAPRLTRRCWPA